MTATTYIFIRPARQLSFSNVLAHVHRQTWHHVEIATLHRYLGMLDRIINFPFHGIHDVYHYVKLH